LRVTRVTWPSLLPGEEPSSRAGSDHLEVGRTGLGLLGGQHRQPSFNRLVVLRNGKARQAGGRTEQTTALAVSGESGGQTGATRGSSGG